MHCLQKTGVADRCSKNLLVNQLTNCVDPSGEVVGILLQFAYRETFGRACFVAEEQQKAHLHEVGAAVAFLDGEAAAGVERALERLRLVELAVPAEGMVQSAQQDVRPISLCANSKAAATVAVGDGRGSARIEQPRAG